MIYGMAILKDDEIEPATTTRSPSCDAEFTANGLERDARFLRVGSLVDRQSKKETCAKALQY